jgi:hypothetical protein
MTIMNFLQVFGHTEPSFYNPTGAEIADETRRSDGQWHWSTMTPPQRGFTIAIALLIIAGYWALFRKAKQHGWAAIIPLYNIFVLLRVVKRPAWWVILYIIPVVDIVFHIIVMHDLAKSFGKGIGYTMFLIFLPFFVLPVLGFGGSVYKPIKR